MRPKIDLTIATFEKGLNTYYLDRYDDDTYGFSQDEFFLEVGYDLPTAWEKFQSLAGENEIKILHDESGYGSIKRRSI